MNKRIVFLTIVAMGSATIYQASHWWEREFATLAGTRISPDGCIRVDTYKPFWLLPSWLHRVPDPDPQFRYPLGKLWGFPMFERAHEIGTGTLLGETIIYDGTASFNATDWNDSKEHGRRIIMSGGFLLADTDRCADAATLAKLEAFYDKEAEKDRVRRKAFETENQPSEKGNVAQEPNISE